MKIYREITPLQTNDVYILCHYINPSFNYPLHNHPEYELCLTLNSKGNRIVGDSVSKYKEKDLVLIGPDICHRWDNEDLPAFKTKEASVLVLQFDKSLFQNYLLSKEAFYPIKHMLRRASRGIEFQGDILEKATKRLLSLAKMDGFDAVVEFLSLLNMLALSKEQKLLTSEGFVAQPENSRSKRINDVYEYIADHLTEKIQISDVAEITNMSESAFSHFFKKSTKKSFTQYLVEVRLGLACKFLVETQDTISQICFKCGFNNVSNFNRLFKKYKGTTPAVHRRQMEDKISNYNFENRFI